MTPVEQCRRLPSSEVGWEQWSSEPLEWTGRQSPYRVSYNFFRKCIFLLFVLFCSEHLRYKAIPIFIQNFIEKRVSSLVTISFPNNIATLLHRTKRHSGHAKMQIM